MMGSSSSSSKPSSGTRRANDISSLAAYIKSSECKNVFLMLGAGVSTSAGIPDFRSPKTGLYSNLARLNLPHPEAVFEINFFRRNPVPFYTLAHELYPGKFRPTITHSFIRLLAAHSKLHTCFTQNIDTLERRAGVPAEKIIEAHGSFATQHCIDCGSDYDDDKMHQHVMETTIPKCECGGLVKPDIVFFGEGLPSEFIHAIPPLSQADLLIIIGTSLTVHPFASLSYRVPSSCQRVLINIDRVGDLGSRRTDKVFLGQCDDIIKDLAKELGWDRELEEMWAETSLDVVGRTPPKETKQAEEEGGEKEKAEVDTKEEEEGKVKGEEVKKGEEKEESSAKVKEGPLAEGVKNSGIDVLSALAEKLDLKGKEDSAEGKDEGKTKPLDLNKETVVQETPSTAVSSSSL